MVSKRTRGPPGTRSAETCPGVLPRGILGVNPALDGVAAPRDIVLVEAQRLAPGDADHLPHQVDAGDHLGHRVLDLDAGVHLDEGELAGGVVAEIFHGAGAAITHRSRQPHREGAQRRTRRRVERRRRSFPPELLAATLQRALALVEVDHAASGAEHLRLDVARLRDEALEIEACIAEGGAGLGARLGQPPGEFALGLGDADSVSAAARHSLDHDREADAAGDRSRLVGEPHRQHLAAGLAANLHG